ncbi:hypothetical protein PENTCL1PPCAC_30154, partial [Pristionchus entomophagus]
KNVFWRSSHGHLRNRSHLGRSGELPQSCLRHRRETRRKQVRGRHWRWGWVFVVLRPNHLRLGRCCARGETAEYRRDQGWK